MVGLEKLIVLTTITLAVQIDIRAENAFVAFYANLAIAKHCRPLDISRGLIIA
jgi:hypothetical protein